MITQKERIMEQTGIRWRKKLVNADAVLSPAGLSTLLPKYGGYNRFDEDGLIQVSSRVAPAEPEPPKKLFVLISGPAGAGKDRVRRALGDVMPGETVKLVTATSRSIREEDGEVQGKDYVFYDGVDAFREAIARNEFLEFSVQGSEKDGNLRLYGIPKQSVRAALERPEPIVVSHAEMSSGWPNLKRYVRSLPNPASVLRLFVLPQMRATTYFHEWLPATRPNDYDERGIRAGWEFWHAPKSADVLVRNVIERGEQALISVAEALWSFLRDRFTAN